MTDVTINLRGWVLVHTWHESHGERVDEIYQNERRDQEWFYKPMNLSIERHLNGSRDGATLHVGDDAKDYLLAKKLQDELKVGAAKELGHEISPCCTAGFRTIEFEGRIYNLTSVAGHGSWASEIEVVKRRL